MTRRWPTAIIFRKIESSYASFYSFHQSYRDNPKLNRYEVVKQLRVQLVELDMECRLQNIRIAREIRMCIRKELQIKENNNVGKQTKFEVR